MKKIILYITASIDGRIAQSGGGMDWLTGFPNPEKTDYGYHNMLSKVDTVIMGGRTYREILNMDVIWPYNQQTTYVVSHHNWGEKENIRFITENVIETISELRNREGKDIWLVGGGELVSMLLATDLIDQMQIIYASVVLGKGIPLFPEQPNESRWKLNSYKASDSGILAVDYIKT
ncbi:MAG: dihydrofolate reductase family protein [Bacteroidota bacterium]|nr:dihydrofolate reductase family protein [Bacteroidota bacterium]